MKVDTLSQRRRQPLHGAPRVAVATLLLFLLFEYLRLHDIFPVLGQLRIQTVTLGALLLMVIIRTAKGRLRLDRQSRYLLGFLGLSVFTIFLAANNYVAYQFAYDLGVTLIAYFAITHILRDDRDLRKFLSVFVSIHIYLAVKAIVGYSHRGFDQSGYTSTGVVGGAFLGDENDVALAFVVILPLGLYLFQEARTLRARLLWGTGSALILLSIIFTFSRGGFVGLAVMTLYWVATSRRKAKAIWGLVVAVALVFAVAPSQYWERIETITNTEAGTARLRRNYWAAARRMFYESPIWGVGGNNFGVLVPDYALEFSEENRGTRWGKAVHSMYFQLLAEFGLIGVFLIGSVLLLNFRDLREVIALNRKGRCPASMGDLACSLQLSWAGFLVPAAFLSVLAYPHLYYLTALTVVMRRLAFAESTEMEVEPIGALQEAG